MYGSHTLPKRKEKKRKMEMARKIFFGWRETYEQLREYWGYAKMMRPLLVPLLKRRATAAIRGVLLQTAQLLRGRSLAVQQRMSLIVAIAVGAPGGTLTGGDLILDYCTGAEHGGDYVCISSLRCVASATRDYMAEGGGRETVCIVYVVFRTVAGGPLHFMITRDGFVPTLLRPNPRPAPGTGDDDEEEGDGGSSSDEDILFGDPFMRSGNEDVRVCQERDSAEVGEWVDVPGTRRFREWYDASSQGAFSEGCIETFFLLAYGKEAREALGGTWGAEEKIMIKTNLRGVKPPG
jgi:hypothetical protein